MVTKRIWICLFPLWLQLSEAYKNHTHTLSHPLSLACTSAPCCSNSWTVLTRLYPAARCNGVDWNSEPTSQLINRKETQTASQQQPTPSSSGYDMLPHRHHRPGPKLALELWSSGQNSSKISPRKDRTTADLSSIAGVTVDVERRQQSHQLLFVPAPVGMSASCRINHRRT